MDHLKEVGGYIDDVLSGRKPACKYVKQACQRQLDDLKREDLPWVFSPWHATRICSFIEKVDHIQGPLKGQKCRLQPWQKFILTTVFGWVTKDQNAFRRFREALVIIPRGNGKSFLTSPIGLYLLAMDGEGGAEVCSAATTRDQAKKVFMIAQEMAKLMPSFRTKYGVEVSAHSINQGVSWFRALSSDAGTLDGLNIHGALIDEFHAHKTRDLYDVLKTACAKRAQPLIWEITTAGSDRSGVCYEQFSYVTRILDGSAKDDRMFGIVYSIDEHGYVDTIDALNGIRWLEDNCRCNEWQGDVATQIERFWREACANFAITDGIASTVPSDALSIQTDKSDLRICAPLATTPGLSPEIQTTEKELTKGHGSGPQKIETSAPQYTENTGSMEGEERSTATNSKSHSGFRGNNSTLCSLPSRVDAQFADRPKTISAWITAMSRESFGDSYASHATAQLVFSEILRNILKEHSPTCPARKARVENGRLAIQIDPDDWATIEAAEKANPNWGVSVFKDAVVAELHQALQIASKQPAYQTKFLDCWVNADVAWMDMGRLAKCADPSLKVEQFIHQDCILGMDLATKLDILALMKLFWKEIEDEDGIMKRHYYVFGDYWTPQARLEASPNSQYRGWALDNKIHTCRGETNDFRVVEKFILDQARQFNILEVAHDPHQAHEMVINLSEEGLLMVEVGQKWQNLDGPMKEIEAAIYDGRFHFDGDPVLSWAFSNVVSHPDKNDNLFPNKERFENKIDPVTALLTGLNRVMANPESGTSVYETRGVVAV